MSNLVMNQENVGVGTAVSLPITHRLKKLVLYTLLLAAALMMLIPFFWMISTSLKADEYVLSIPLIFIPRPLTFESYRRLTEIYPMPRMFWNSLVVAVLTTAGQLIVSAMAAYAFARIEFRGRNVLFVLYLATLMMRQKMVQREAPSIKAASSNSLGSVRKN